MNKLQNKNALILVTGATGTVGSEVVKQLIEVGHKKIRVLVRNPAKASKFGNAVEIAKGDFEDPASLRAALKDIEVAFLATAPTERMVEHEINFIVAAEAIGLKRLVKLSNIMATPENPAPAAKAHGEIELRLAKSGIPTTILRPGWYMSNFFGDAQSIKMGQLYSATESGRISFIDTSDVAAVAVAVLLDSAHSGHNYKLTGPESLSYEEVGATFTRILGHPVKHIGVDDKSLRVSLEAASFPEFIIDEILKVSNEVRRGDLELVSNAVLEVLNRPANSLEKWIESNRNTFSK